MNEIIEALSFTASITLAIIVLSLLVFASLSLAEGFADKVVEDNHKGI